MLRGKRRTKTEKPENKEEVKQEVKQETTKPESGIETKTKETKHDQEEVKQEVKQETADEKPEQKRPKTPVKFTDSTYFKALESLPNRVSTLSSWKATTSLLLVMAFSFMSFHALAVSPSWALPIFWILATLSIIFVFEIGNDCARGVFFPSNKVNNVVGAFFLTIVFQPFSYWKQVREQGGLRNWFAAAVTRSWRSACLYFTFSHVLVFTFACFFFPMMIHYLGWWGLTKFWLIPFILFHLSMALYVNAGQSIKSLDVNEKKPAVGLQLRSYLRFQLQVPVYKTNEALDVIKRMWNRASLDTDERENVQNVQELLENPSYSALLLGYSNQGMLYYLLSSLLWPLCFLWVWLAWQSSLPLPFTRVARFGRQAFSLLSVENISKLYSLSNFYILTGIVLVLIVTRKINRRKTVYLLDFVTYTPPAKLAISLESFKQMQRKGPFTEDSLAFMDKLVDRTGLGEETYFPEGIHATPPQLTMAMSRAEAEMVISGSLDRLFATTGISPRDIDILVVNCSLFCPTPSLSSMIISKYKMRQDIQSYNLGGMGCSAGVIAVHLAKDLLQTYKNSRAIVFSTENITQNWYLGNDRSMLVSNTLFRVGGAAILLSNRSGDRRRSKYKLMHSVRTHMGADDTCYKAVFQDADADGVVGVRLDKGLMTVAGEALKRNITTLGPLILPWSEQVSYFMNHFNRKIRKLKVKPYVPNFTTAIQHFCIHAGGRAVLEAIEKALSLSPQHLEASRAVLHRMGNTSSSSIWYELAYLEKKGAIRAGDRIWQIAFGSGFKCNSAVWKAL